MDTAVVNTYGWFGLPYHGTSLLRANLDSDLFIFQEMYPLSAEVGRMELTATNAGNMMGQGG